MQIGALTSVKGNPIMKPIASGDNGMPGAIVLLTDTHKGLNRNPWKQRRLLLALKPDQMSVPRPARGPQLFPRALAPDHLVPDTHNTRPMH